MNRWDQCARPSGPSQRRGGTLFSIGRVRCGGCGDDGSVEGEDDGDGDDGADDLVTSMKNVWLRDDSGARVL